MFTLIPTNQFNKDVKILKKRSAKNADLLIDFLSTLQQKGVIGIDKKHRPHKLSGNYKDNWEAHIKPDLLIIWFEVTEKNEIILLRTGSHSDLF
ncbi:type II toxin-antitoxin system YafQ family toxin [Mucilaginibacter mali]|uniref:Type II toxin-antitoxin system YafQ family toxin n=1 Tax=Mucilaginibacter mali TaxID=2740462 RepID=A0A7D4UKN1_9SPHI|nr:type II toxin-antitoxin system YafQ family toxin [Mucilaginibacter mali]QKJ30882.1 type II toxin-antitoxin system YafQ family toxin [Mucilaginibacter mali]